jgi:hypothetical protein
MRIVLCKLNGDTMQQIANYSPGGIVYLRTSRNLITAPATLRMRIMQKNVEPNIEPSCSYPGGKIKATVLEIMHVDPVGPEPGVGYGWSSKEKRHLMQNDRSGMLIQSATCDYGRSGGVHCT